MANVLLANIGFDEKVLSKKGFGYLVPSQESQNILGMVWDSETFPQQNAFANQTRLTMMLGGMRNKEISTYSRKKLEALVCSYLVKHLGVEKTPNKLHFEQINRAIPQFPIGFQMKKSAALKELTKKHPNFKALGNCFSGVSVCDCIKGGYDFAQEFDDLPKK